MGIAFLFKLASLFNTHAHTTSSALSVPFKGMFQLFSTLELRGYVCVCINGLLVLTPTPYNHRVQWSVATGGSLENRLAAMHGSLT